MLRKMVMATALLLVGVAAHALELTVDVTSGTCTAAVSEFDVFGHQSQVMAVEIAWVSDADGDVTATIPGPIHGSVLRVTTNPGATAPTDNWDVVILDSDGIDILAGGGANRDTTNSEHFAPLVSTYVPMTIAGEMNLAITNAGAAKNGTIKLYIER